MLDPDMLLGRQGQNMALISVTRLRVRSFLEAHRKMVAEGRRSKVRHPSPAHEAYQIAPPKLRPRSRNLLRPFRG